MLLTDSLIVIGMAVSSLGTINEADGPRQQQFQLVNAGSQPVTLLQGYTSCGCTTISLATGTAVAPGDTAAVTLRFNPRGKGGEFEETGTVEYATAAGQRRRVQMSLVGTCITSEETLLRQFPVRVSDQLRLSAQRFDLGIVRPGERRERHVTVLHRDDGDRRETLTVSFAADSQTPKGVQHIERPLTVHTTQGDVTFTILLDVLVK